MTRNRRKDTAGFTLLELLAYMFVLAIILNVTAKTAISGRRIHALGDLAMARMDSLRDVESDFRKAAAQSNRVYPLGDEFPFGANAFALAGRGDDESLRLHVWRLTEDESLIYEVYRKDARVELLRRKKYAIQVTGFNAHGESDRGDGTVLVEFLLTIRNEGTAHLVPAEHRLAACLVGGTEDD